MATFFMLSARNKRCRTETCEQEPGECDLASDRVRVVGLGAAFTLIQAVSTVPKPNCKWKHWEV